MRQKQILQRTGLYLLVLVLVVVALFPLFWAIVGSLKSNAELFKFPFTLWPKAATLDNYRSLFHLSNFLNSIQNSIVVSLSATAASLVIACLAGYSLTRFQFPGSRLLTRLVMDTYMIPPILLVLPIYTVIVGIGLRDSLWVYGVMLMANTLPFCLWLVNSYYAGIAVDYEEAAMMDGATRFKAFYRVVLPQLTPAIVSVGIQSFVLCWNDLLFAQILLSSDKNRTLPLAITAMFGQELIYPWGVVLAATVVATVPVLIMFTFGVEKLIGGWSDGGVKG